MERSDCSTRCSPVSAGFSYVDTSQPELIEQALRPNTRLLFVETPTNPVMRLTDLARAAEIARKANVRMVVDNTFASPYVQRPLELGADLVVHSTTKYSTATATALAGSLSRPGTTTSSGWASCRTPRGRS